MSFIAHSRRRHLLNQFGLNYNDVFVVNLNTGFSMVYVENTDGSGFIITQTSSGPRSVYMRRFTYDPAGGLSFTIGGTQTLQSADARRPQACLLDTDIIFLLYFVNLSTVRAKIVDVSGGGVVTKGTLDTGISGFTSSGYECVKVAEGYVVAPFQVSGGGIHWGLFSYSPDYMTITLEYSFNPSGTTTSGFAHTYLLGVNGSGNPVVAISSTIQIRTMEVDLVNKTFNLLASVLGLANEAFMMCLTNDNDVVALQRNSNINRMAIYDTGVMGEVLTLRDTDTTNIPTNNLNTWSWDMDRFRGQDDYIFMAVVDIDRDLYLGWFKATGESLEMITYFKYVDTAGTLNASTEVYPLSKNRFLYSYANPASTTQTFVRFAEFT